jgi:hypothetical protein
LAKTKQAVNSMLRQVADNRFAERRIAECQFAEILVAENGKFLPKCFQIGDFRQAERLETKPYVLRTGRRNF